uniref:ORF45 n=1 Tax=Malaco herpesvirus 2 TaxID=3031798 RepID=A0AA48SEZ5_9VIRU|nr:TPA_asm: ORF45 [Malaco herpesvirus 2]
MLKDVKIPTLINIFYIILLLFISQCDTRCPSGNITSAGPYFQSKVDGYINLKIFSRCVSTECKEIKTDWMLTFRGGYNASEATPKTFALQRKLLSNQLKECTVKLFGTDTDITKSIWIATVGRFDIFSNNLSMTLPFIFWYRDQ